VLYLEGVERTSLRYKLDDLGWYQFEWMTQSLLKAELGIGVESWGGRGDFGRDAYSSGSLPFPSRHINSEGPFVFQVKFVEPEGTDRFARLRNAVHKERDRISSRQTDQPDRWSRIAHYVLITNIDLNADQRTATQDEFAKVLPNVAVHTLSGKDVCDLLDHHADLRRSFPQLLSLRDLDGMLEEAATKDVRERSRAAIESAREVIPSFVPTESYRKAWAILLKRHFCVLEGPPEMGKTAIAWTIALSQICRGWEAVVCDRPDDLYRAHSQDRKQVFIADDAFGRTEYDPSRGKDWEQQIDRVLRIIDKNHWLIWTSRRYILESALRAMDLQGKAAHFPDPGDILVDATKLTDEEKALILYRHARARSLDATLREIVRCNAKSVVRNPHFTPERIRRFVEDVLPSLATGWPETKSVVADKITESIRNPTERMKKSFRALPRSHQWLLIAILQEGNFPLKSSVEEGYQLLCPTHEFRPFEDAHRELRESFLRDTFLADFEVISWIHPSYRDLVIEQLEAEPQQRRHFLRHLSVDGLKLALTECGYDDMPRKFIETDEDWNIVCVRVLELAADPSERSTDLMDALTESIDQIKQKSGNSGILANVAAAIKNKWDMQNEVLNEREILSFSRFSECLEPLPPFPNLSATLNKARAAVEELTEQVDNEQIDADEAEGSAKLFAAIQSVEPRLLRQAGIHAESALLKSLIRAIEEDRNWKPTMFDAEQYRSESARAKTLADSLDLLAKVFPELIPPVEAITTRLRRESERYEERANEEDPPEPDYDPSDSRERPPTQFDIDGVFADL
jgi:hypothetical protein